MSDEKREGLVGPVLSGEAALEHLQGKVPVMTMTLLYSPETQKLAVVGHLNISEEAYSNVEVVKGLLDGARALGEAGMQMVLSKVEAAEAKARGEMTLDQLFSLPAVGKGNN